MMEKFPVFLEKLKRYKMQLSNLYLICKSGFFDKDWYLANNPGVVQAEMNPLLHPCSMVF